MKYGEFYADSTFSVWVFVKTMEITVNNIVNMYKVSEGK